MTINIDLSPEKEGDWLAGATAGDGVDLWERLDESERKRRADSAQIRSLTDELASRGVTRTQAKRLGTQLYERVTDDQFREIRKRALERDSDDDYVDTISAEIADLVGISTQQRDLRQRASNVVRFGQQGTAEVYDPPAMGRQETITALREPLQPGIFQGRTSQPVSQVVEISEKAERLTADYSSTLETGRSPQRE